MADQRDRKIVELVIDASGLEAGERRASLAYDHLGERAAAAQAKATAAIQQSMRIYENQLPQSIEKTAAAYDKLRSKTDPVLAAQLKLESEMTRSLQVINRAVLQGVTTQQEAEQQVLRLRNQQVEQLDNVRRAQERLNETQRRGANDNARASGNFNASNLAAQGFDIASTAAFMPWYTVALQQGPQVSQVFNDIKASGQAIGPAVAGAFMQILNPISLVTIGVIGGVAALVQYFATAEGGTEKTSKLFEEQNGIIRQSASLWGEAAPALKAYVDQLDRADKLTQGKQAGEILAGRELDGLSGNLDAIQRQGVAAFRALQGDPRNAVIIRDLRDAWGDLRDRLDDGTASMADLNRVQRELGNAVAQYGVPDVLSFRDAFEKVTETIYRSIEAAQKVRTEWIAAIAGGTNVQDIVSGSTFTDGGRTFSASQFMPANIPVPERRPLDLDQNPGAPIILNSDGRLTNVPIPASRPNFFEIEDQTAKVNDLEKAYRSAQEAKANFWLDIGFQERQSARNPMDRQVASTLTRYGFNEDLGSPEATAIRQQIIGQQAKDIAKGFGDAFSSELISGSHNIGKAFLKGFEATLSSEASKLWEKFFDSIGNVIASSLARGSGSGSSVAGAGTSVVSRIFGAANDNAVGTAPVIPVTRSPLGDLGAYAKAIKSIESGGNYGALGPLTKAGDRAYGAYQVMGANIPSWTMGATGKSLTPSEFLSTPSAQDAVFNKYFGASVSKYGNPQDAASVWFTGRPLAQGAGASDILGTTGSAYVDKFNDALGSATKNLGGFGDGLGQIGSALSNTSFPAAPAASGGGGGLFGWLGSLFGGFKPIGAQATLAASGSIAGLFDRGGYTGHGGVNDPAGIVHRGEIVWSQADIARAGGPGIVEGMRLGYQGYASGGAAGGNVVPIRPAPATAAGRMKVDVGVSVDKDGSLIGFVKSIVQEDAPGIADTVTRQQIADERKQDVRGGFSKTQREYMARKG